METMREIHSYVNDNITYHVENWNQLNFLNLSSNINYNIEFSILRNYSQTTHLIPRPSIHSFHKKMLFSYVLLNP